MADTMQTLRESINANKKELLRIAAGGEPSVGNGNGGSRSKSKSERLKALSSSQLETGGKLLPEQRDKFETFVRGSSDIMEHADINMVDSPEGQIDSIYISSSVTKAYTEGTTATETATPILGKDSYETVELYGAIDINHRTLTRNIMRDDFADHVVNMVLEAMGYDIAYAVVNGDTGSADPLLAAFDGLQKMTDSAHVLSAGGSEASMDLFSGALAAFPDKKKRFLRKKLNWMGHSRLWADWDDTLYSRISNLGDSAFGGNAPTPYGIPRLVVDEFSTTESVAYTSALAANHECTIAGPFTFTTSANQISLNINASGATVHTIPAGTYRAVEFAYALNTLLVAAGDPEIVSVTPEGKIRFETPTTGAGTSIVIAAPANDLLGLIGATAGTYTGAAAGSNTKNIGTYMLLTDPKNLWVGVLDELRIFWDWVARKNRWELTVYTELVPFLRDPDAVVKVKDIKLKEYL